MIITKNIILEGHHNKPILLDIFLPKQTHSKKTLIYCHGFKGFKDWGTNDILAKHFAENGINFLKFNFSHNGGTVNQPIDFPDLEAFGKNNFTKELDDLECVINWIENQNEYENLSTENQMTLMAHSRGSGIIIIKAKEDPRVDKVISLAGVSDFSARFIDDATLEYWKKTGVIYVENSRTKQQMPLYYQLAEDVFKNTERLSVENASKALNKPHLIIHGTQDPTVNLEEAKKVHKWSKQSKLVVIQNADHVFNVKHPWNEDRLPQQFQLMLDKSLEFVTSE
ncbi:MAG: alpha/beta hydrolase [Flavobacteriaceae bacterium]